MTKTIGDIPAHKVLKGFLGTDTIPKKIVLTPIGYIYDEIKGRYDAKEIRGGWWDNFTYKANNKQEVIVVLTHQGNTIVDPTLIANYRCDYLLFLGFCGGLHPDMKIGDITIATQSYFENGDIIYKPQFDIPEVRSVFPNSIQGTNLTVESVIRETKAIKSKKPGYLKEGTVSVDQETAYLYRDSEIPTSSVMVISDLPLTKTAFELSYFEKKQINRGVKKIADGILELMDLL
jgi:purine-nucleoside phosphorylase